MYQQNTNSSSSVYIRPLVAPTFVAPAAGEFHNYTFNAEQNGEDAFSISGNFALPAHSGIAFGIRVNGLRSRDIGEAVVGVSFSAELGGSAAIPVMFSYESSVSDVTLEPDPAHFSEFYLPRFNFDYISPESAVININDCNSFNCNTETFGYYRFVYFGLQNTSDTPLEIQGYLTMRLNSAERNPLQPWKA